MDKERRLTTIDYNLYVLKNSEFKWNGDYSTIDFVIGAPIGYSIVNDLRLKGIIVEESQDSYSNLLKVSKRSVGAAALQSVTADRIIQ